MQDRHLDDIASLAINLATEAGELLRTGQNTARAAVSGTKSSLTDVVTELDRESEARIVAGIRAHRPDDAILGEEGACFDGTSGVRWVVDPLDATVNFTYGIPMYAVSIGVEVNDDPVVGVVFNPATHELWTAIRGRGAKLNDVHIEARPAPQLSNALVATGFGYQSERRIHQVETLARVLPAVRDIRRAGAAALDICWVADGRVDAYYELGIKPWDIAAGEVIASEAGAFVTSYEGGRPEGSVIAGRAPLHAELQRLINQRTLLRR